MFRKFLLVSGKKIGVISNTHSSTVDLVILAGPPAVVFML